jgi:adenylate cyclase
MALEHILTPFRIATLIGLFIVGLRIAGCSTLDQADLRAMDFRLLQRGALPASPDVVVLAIDDASIAEIGRWPWPRSVMARLIDRLTDAEPAAVGFDIVQSEATAAQSFEGVRARVDGIDAATWQRVRDALNEVGNEDQLLVDAVRRSNRVVLGYFLETDAQTPLDPEDRPTGFNIVRPSRDGSGERLIASRPSMRGNLPVLTAAARGVGFFNVFQDDDGFVRSMPMAIRIGDRLVVPLSLAMWRVYRPDDTLQIKFETYGVESLRVGGTELPVSEDGQLFVNYRGRGRTIAHVSAVDLLNGRVAADRLRNKLVVVGVTATAVADVRVTPFDGIFPGAETHATVLDNLLRNDFISRPRWVLYPEIALIFYAVYSLGFALSSVSGSIGAIGTMAMIVAYIFGTQWIFRASGLVLSFVYPLSAIALTYVTVALRQYVVVSRQRRELRHALGLYLAPAVARLVSERPEMLQLGGDKRELTVFFCDIRGFSAIAEQLEPGQLVELLHVYLGSMTDAVFAHDGTLDKYIGDAIMAFWGAPLAQQDHAERACAAAIEMVHRLHDLEGEWEKRNWPTLEMGIGINSGEMVVGNMGSERRLSYTVAGDNVNIASRLEGLTKVYGSRIIASDNTIELMRETVVARELDIVRVQGRAAPVRIFELLGPASETQRWAPLRSAFAAGLFAYRARQWERAIDAFVAVLKERPNDKPSLLFVERCRHFLEAPPDADWDGVTAFDRK